MNQQTSVADSGIPNCRKCEHFVEPWESAAWIGELGKPHALPMCGVKKIPLATFNSNSAQVKSIQNRAASNCDYYKKPAGDSLGEFSGFISEPLANTVQDPSGEKAKACSACINYAPADQALSQLGIESPVCVALGKIIAVGEGRRLARDCAFNSRHFGPPKFDLAKLQLLSHYTNNLTVINLDGSMILSDTPGEDPALSETDKPVTDGDASAGIRAWKRIDDPDGTGNFIMLPVFDHGYFSPIEQAKIPSSGDDEHPELYQDHQGLAYKMGVLWLHMNETPALNGVAGVGKTEAYRYLAYLMQLPFERLSITNSTELDDLAGRWVLEPDEDTNTNKTSFVYGRLPQAWSKPCVVCVDEPNTGPPDVWQFIRPLTDSSKQMVIDMNRGERIDRHRFCFLGMAMNPSWDVRNSGTHQIADADGSRLMHIAVPSPHEDLEREILTRRCNVDSYSIPGNILDAIMKISVELRLLAEEDDSLSVSWGTRQTIKVARSTQWFTLIQSVRLAIADLVEPQEAERILAIVKSHEPRKASSPRGANDANNLAW